MKIRIFAFVLALTVLFGSLYAPEKVYAAENSYPVNIGDLSYDLANDTNFMAQINQFENPSYFAFLYQENSVLVFVIDTSKARNIYFKTDSLLFSEPLGSLNGLQIGVCSEMLDGTFDPTYSSGVYYAHYSIEDGSLVPNKFSPNFQESHATTYHTVLFHAVEVHYNTLLDRTKNVSDFISMLIDGNVTIKGAEYVDDKYVVSSVFHRPLPQAILPKVAKGISMDPMKQILRILPMAIAFLVGCVGLRKALAILDKILHQA